ncbi:TetR/AcrR family transcriptional regulator [Longispora albida]|uniref:TetR/AcrR family transcriptional regulator n=1 Tax=Longispora albida TaxID=203523 RepID=UPI0003738768|nr:TetR/AcrR family transcriptional regulator [Longispora albida]
MTSTRNNEAHHPEARISSPEARVPAARTPDARGSEARTSEDLILDAARDRIIAVGLRRTTLTDIARRAGVSRMTIYRRWPDMAGLVADVMTREFTGQMAGVAAAAQGATVRERMVSGLVDGVRVMRAHPMFRRIVELDPEVLLPYVVDRLGASQLAMLTQLVAQIEAGQSEGSIRAVQPELLGRGVLLTVQSFTISGQIMIEEQDFPVLDAELTLLLDRYLAS